MSSRNDTPHIHHPLLFRQRQHIAFEILPTLLHQLTTVHALERDLDVRSANASVPAQTSCKPDQELRIAVANVDAEPALFEEDFASFVSYLAAGAQVRSGGSASSRASSRLGETTT
jgi:hypothetical protein